MSFFPAHSASTRLFAGNGTIFFRKVWILSEFWYRNRWNCDWKRRTFSMHAISCKRPFTNNVSVFDKNWTLPLPVLTNPLLGRHHLWTVPKCTLQINMFFIVIDVFFYTNLVSNQMNDMAILLRVNVLCFISHHTSVTKKKYNYLIIDFSFHFILHLHIKNHLIAFEWYL